jgi:hypothetical protein
MHHHLSVPLFEKLELELEFENEHSNVAQRLRGLYASALVHMTAGSVK